MRSRRDELPAHPPYSLPSSAGLLAIRPVGLFHAVAPTSMMIMAVGGSVRALIWVSGRVQGVAYRAFTVRTASQHGVRGGVRNLDDGRVAVEAEGERQAIESLIASLRIGPPMARVEDVQVQWSTPTHQYDDFRIWC